MKFFDTKQAKSCTTVVKRFIVLTSNAISALVVIE